MDLILLVSQLGQNPLLPSCPALLPQQRLLHRRRPTNHDLGILLFRRHADFSQQLLRNIPLTEPLAIHALSTTTNRVHRLEPLTAILGLIRLKLLTQENILFGIHTKHKTNLGLVLRVGEDALDELVGRGDACAACDEGDGVVEVGGPFEAWYDDGEEQRVAGGKGVDVSGLLAVWVALDEEIDGAGLRAVGDWCVRTQDGEGLSRGPRDGEKSG